MDSQTSSTVTMPTALVFLVSNFSNFVTIKLDAHNFILWKNQVRNALSANGYLGFIDGTTKMPCPEILDSNQNKISNPEYVKWMMINGHLLACITASVSPSIQTHLLGLEHVYEVWTSLSNRFSSLSRSHIHDLRQRLFNITKTTTMQVYLDEISDCAHKLAASGSPIDDEDLVFYALNGLPSEFDPIKSAARMRAGELKFEELTSLLEAEDMILQKTQSKCSAKLDGSTILVTTQTPGVQGQASSSHQVFNAPSHQIQGNVFPQQQGANVGQNYGGQNQPQQFYNSSQYNRNRGVNRGGFNRGYKGQQGQQQPCQICFRTNHTAATCHYRQNLNYQPPQYAGFQSQNLGYQSSQPQPSQFQNHYVSRPVFQTPQSSSSQVYGSSQFGPMQYPNFSQQSSGHQTVQRFPQAHFTYTGPAPQFPTAMNCGPPMNSGSSNGTNSTWYLDSGATSHVTNDLSNLNTQQQYTGDTGVMVGNGSTLPISHCGSTYEPSSSQRSLSPGSLSNLSLY